MNASDLERHPQSLQELKYRVLCYILDVNNKKIITIAVIPPEKKELQALEREGLSSSLSEFHSIHWL